MKAFLALVGQGSLETPAQGASVQWFDKCDPKVAEDRALATMFEDRLREIPHIYATLGSKSPTNFEAVRVGVVGANLGAIAYLGYYGFAEPKNTNRGAIPLAVVFGAVLGDPNWRLPPEALDEIRRLYAEYRSMAVNQSGKIQESIKGVFPAKWNIDLQRLGLAETADRLRAGASACQCFVDSVGDVFIARRKSDDLDLKMIVNQLANAFHPNSAFDAYVAVDGHLEKSLIQQAEAGFVRHPGIDSFLSEIGQHPNVIESQNNAESAIGKISKPQVERIGQVKQSRADKPVATVEGQALSAGLASLDSISATLKRLDDHAYDFLARDKHDNSKIFGIIRHKYVKHVILALAFFGIVTSLVLANLLLQSGGLPSERTATPATGKSTENAERLDACLTAPPGTNLERRGVVAWDALVEFWQKPATGVANSATAEANDINRTSIKNVEDFMKAAKESFAQEIRDCIRN